MGLEIERKFLVDHEKWKLLAKPQGVAFSQGYLMGDKSKTIRIRIAGDKAYLTIKGITTGIARKEYEYEIPVADARELLGNMTDNQVEKTRYCIPQQNKLWEVDVFAGANQGLIVAEIELESENEAFDKPDWVTAEVSGDNRYYNSALALNPFTKWA